MQRQPMLLESPLVPSSLVDQAFERIADAIVMGEIQPGERVREALLARNLGISRGVLREAMQRLEGLKLVSRTSNIGVHVISLSQDDLYELYIVREALEGMAARLSAERMTQEERDGLRQLLDRHGKHKDLRRGDGYYQPSADEDFHFRIARGSRNERLIRSLCDELYYQLRLYRYRSSVRPGRAQLAFAEHQAVVDAICAGDGDKAEAAMRLHLRNARESLMWPSEEAPTPAKAAPAARARRGA